VSIRSGRFMLQAAHAYHLNSPTYWPHTRGASPALRSTRRSRSHHRKERPDSKRPESDKRIRARAAGTAAACSSP
jgi:hypothetical protein